MPGKFLDSYSDKSNEVSDLSLIMSQKTRKKYKNIMIRRGNVIQQFRGELQNFRALSYLRIV